MWFVLEEIFDEIRTSLLGLKWRVENFIMGLRWRMEEGLLELPIKKRYSVVIRSEYIGLPTIDTIVSRHTTLLGAERKFNKIGLMSTTVCGTTPIIVDSENNEVGH